jgi:hypothetical protein
LDIEDQLKQRIPSFSVSEAIYVLKTFSQCHAGSAENTYKVLERFLGANSNSLTPD